MTYTVALDCDGVLFDFVGAFRRGLNRELGRAALPAAWMPEAWDVSKDPQVRAAIAGIDGDVVSAVYRGPFLGADVNPYPYAANLLKRLHDTGARLIFATSPMKGNREWCYHRTRACAALCLAAGVPDLPVVFTADKTLVHAHLLVDDRPSHVRAFDALPRDAIGILFDQPYNRAESVPFRLGPEGLVVFVTEQVARRGGSARL